MTEMRTPAPAEVTNALDIDVPARIALPAPEADPVREGRETPGSTACGTCPIWEAGVLWGSLAGLGRV
jgi:hypothetical protein